MPGHFQAYQAISNIAATSIAARKVRHVSSGVAKLGVVVCAVPARLVGNVCSPILCRGVGGVARSRGTTVHVLVIRRAVDGASDLVGAGAPGCVESGDRGDVGDGVIGRVGAGTFATILLSDGSGHGSVCRMIFPSSSSQR